jgi:hypothetical protein
MEPFDYPLASHQRRHGPRGYSQPESYQPWLRDEFSFRCVYCLIREQWGRVTGEFDVEHFRPQAIYPELATVYDNLLYACGRCNGAKGDRVVPDPCEALTANQVRLLPDGSFEGRSSEALSLIAKLGLNSPQMKRWRLIWIRNVQLARENDDQQYDRLMQYPDELPDLSRLRPPGGNTRPGGIVQSCLSQRERGELPGTY